MSIRTLCIASSIAAIASAGLSSAIGGWKGLVGFLLGLFATGFGIAVWWLVTSIICNTARLGAKPHFANALILVAFVVKIPLFIAAMLLTVKIGGAARGCFLGGLGLVYLCLVGRGLARDADPPS